MAAGLKLIKHWRAAVMKTPESLWPAIRQYRHNNDNSPSLFDPREGFVMAFAEEETIELVTMLEAENKLLCDAAQAVYDDRSLPDLDGSVTVETEIMERLGKALHQPKESSSGE